MIANFSSQGQFAKDLGELRVMSVKGKALAQGGRCKVHHGDPFRCWNSKCGALIDEGEYRAIVKLVKGDKERDTTVLCGYCWGMCSTNPDDQERANRLMDDEPWNS